MTIPKCKIELTETALGAYKDIKIVDDTGNEYTLPNDIIDKITFEIIGGAFPRAEIHVAAWEISIKR